VHAGGGADNGGEKRNVLIVSILLPVAIDLALRSNMQRPVCQVAILQWVAATPIMLRDAKVEDQAPAASLVSQVVPDLHVAAPLACAGRDSSNWVRTVCPAVLPPSQLDFFFREKKHKYTLSENGGAT
jgi:hypothetical protein